MDSPNADGRSSAKAGVEPRHFSSASEVSAWLIDMDGVLVREERPIEGATLFLDRLRERATPFLILTNNSIYTRRDLTARLRSRGIQVSEEQIWTSALATRAIP